ARDREPAAREHFALRRLLARRADALLSTGDDDFEATRRERIRREQALAVDDQPGVRVLRDVLRIEVEAHPRRRHRIGVDVVEQVLRTYVVHGQRQRAGELTADQIGILRQIEDALAGRQRKTT